MKKQIFGWIYPNNFFEECSIFKHNLLFYKEDFIALDKRISDLLNELSDIEKNCEELISIGEHPEWHIYEIAQDNSHSKFLEIAYELGFLRIGSTNDSLYVEGSKKTIENKIQFLIYFKEKYDFQHLKLDKNDN